MSLPPGNDAAAGLRRLLLNGSYQGLANAYYVFVRGIYVIVFARVLGVEAYGQYLYAQSWSGLALGIAVWGLNELALAEYVNVITSYSIHYTKLYDSAPQPLCAFCGT